MNEFGFGFDMGGTKSRVLQSIYADNAKPAQGASPGTDLGAMFNSRMQTVMQQIAQYADLNSLPVHAANIDDAARALKIHNFAQVTDAQMDAKNIETGFKAGMNYLSIV